nr:CaiB/BaiF CoA-transferase family protein [Streptomyces longispororuber]
MAGLRVIELAAIGPGPFAALVLADLGAEVLRIDRPVPAAPVPDVDPRTDLLKRNRRSAVIDLRHPDAADVVLALVEKADVLLEGYRPGVAERLGIGPGPCTARNPALVYGRVSGWGRDGPLAGRAGHDIDYLARCGALHALGRRNARPTVQLNSVGDFGGGGMLLVTGVLAALCEALRSGRGQVVDAAIMDGATLLTSMTYGFTADDVWNGGRGTDLLDPGVPWYEVYETRDGGFMAVGALEDPFYAALVAGLGLSTGETDRADPAGWSALRARFAAVFRTRTRAEWTEVFEHTDACVTPVLTPLEAASDPHLRARGVFIDVDGVRQPAPVPRFSRTPGTVRRPPPLPGEHTSTVLADWGVPDVDGLLASGAARQRPAGVSTGPPPGSVAAEPPASGLRDRRGGAGAPHDRRDGRWR